MYKTDLHNILKTLSNETAGTEVTIPDSVIIEIYGKDDERQDPTKPKGVMMNRAQVLARTYGLTVVKQVNDYVFTK